MNLSEKRKGRVIVIKKNFDADWQLAPNKAAGLLEPATNQKDSQKISLPYDCLIGEKRSLDTPSKDKKGYYPTGKATLIKNFDVPTDWVNKKAQLYFDGIYRNSRVYINNILAAQEPTGFTSFIVNLNPYLKYGQKNEVKVTCLSNNDSRWYTGLGIYRDVQLYLAPLTYIPVYGVRFTTQSADEKLAVVQVKTTVVNEQAKGQKLQVHVQLQAGNSATVKEDIKPLTLFKAGKVTVESNLSIKEPRLWSPSHPRLYHLVVKIKDETGQVIDQDQETVGIRSLWLSTVKGLEINGQTIKLKGACIHSDNGLIGMAQYKFAEARRIKRLHDAGFNAIRSAHNQASQATLEACDRYGMVVLDELSDVWEEHNTDEDIADVFAAHWRKMADALVDSAYNHPSVVLYSIGNEIRTINTPYGAAEGRKIAAYIKAKDSTRYITEAVNFLICMPEVMASLMKKNGNAKGMDINYLLANIGEIVKKVHADPITDQRLAETFSALDIAGYNYGSDLYEKDGQRHPNRIICGTETYPSEVGTTWPLIKKLPYVIGDFMWTGWDYLGEAGIGQERYAGMTPDQFNGKYPWRTAYCGDFDLIGDRRPVSYYREIVWGQRQKPYLAVRYPWIQKKLNSLGWGFIDGISSWTWRGYENKPITVEVYANSDEVELSLNDKVLAKKKVKDCKAIFEIKYQPGKITATAIRHGQKAETMTLQTADEKVHLQAKAEQTNVDLSCHDLAYIDLSVVDENGILTNQKDCEVTVQVENGQLLGFGSANPKNEDNYTTGKAHTFNGRALAIIKPQKVGEMKVTFESEDLNEEAVNIEVK